jgi:hypothetical protein
MLVEMKLVQADYRQNRTWEKQKKKKQKESRLLCPFDRSDCAFYVYGKFLITVKQRVSYTRKSRRKQVLGCPFAYCAFRYI